MSGIFPPADKGGRPPGGNVCNGYTPQHRVVGDGPYYIAADCTTTLTDCQMNSLVSEILAAIDQVNGGVPYNSGRVDNLAQALTAAFEEEHRLIDLKVNRAGDTMEGPLVLVRDPQQDFEASSKRYVDNLNALLNVALRAFVEEREQALVDDYRARINDVDARKINRAGDTMSGPLALARQPINAMEATPKSYVDQAIAEAEVGGGGGGGGPVNEAPYDDFVYGRINHTWVRLIDDGEYV
jgi:hypothetical protein